MPILPDSRRQPGHGQQYCPQPAHHFGGKHAAICAYSPRTNSTGAGADSRSRAGSLPAAAGALAVSHPEDLSELYALRYRIYCLERRFLCPSNYPSGLEIDIDDQRSAHFLARNSTNVTVGTARLVLGDRAEPFPVEKHCSTFPDFIPPPSNLAAEVSRLAVCKHAQSDPGEPPPWAGQIRRSQLAADQVAASRQRSRNSPTVVLRLYRQMYRYSREHGIRYWYAAMEKSLLRVMARYGVVFTQIGPLQDYYGPVSPYIIALETLDKQLEATNPALLRWFRQDA